MQLWHKGPRSETAATRQRAHQGSGGTRKKDIYEIFREKVMEHVVGTSSGLWKMRWTSWRGRPPPKWKKKQC
jgi:hypothetical protein